MPICLQEDVAIGKQADNGDIIQAVIFRNDELAVYFTKEGKPGFECSQTLANDKQQVIQLHDSLVTLIRLSLYGKSKAIAYQQLGYALNNSLLSEVDDSGLHLQSVKKFVQEQASNQARVSYVAGSSIGFLVLFLLYLIGSLGNAWNSNSELFVLAALMGSAGAWASIVQRAHQLAPEICATHLYHGFMGLTRAVLGLLFGVILVFLCKSNIILGFANGNVYTLGVLSFLSGFNERYIPEMLDRVVKSTVQTSEAIN